jgi:hypothetical protein
MDVLDVHAMEAGVNIPQFLLEHFLPVTFSHFTRDFVGDFDILLMLKVGLKGDSKGRGQQREGGGGDGNRGGGLRQQELQRFGVMSEGGQQPQQNCKLGER